MKQVALPDSRPARRMAGLGLLAIGLVFLSGCALRDSIQWIFGPNNVMEGMNPRFSFNVFEPPKWWPDEDSFTSRDKVIGNLKKQYYDEHGAPDYLRVWYNPEGTPLPRESVTHSRELPEPKSFSWIYLSRNVEVVFTRQGAEEKPISDEVKTICENGDPDEVRFIGHDPNIRMVRYIYHQKGLQIDFQNFKIVKKQHLPGMPGWMR